MQIVINNPANVEMTHKDTLESLKALTAKMVTMQEAIDNPQAAPAPVIQNVINVPDQPAPVVNVTNQVSPTPVTVKNDVRPSPVVIAKDGKRKAKIKRDRDGKITEITADDEA